MRTLVHADVLTLPRTGPARCYRVSAEASTPLADIATELRSELDDPALGFGDEPDQSWGAYLEHTAAPVLQAEGVTRRSTGAPGAGGMTLSCLAGPDSAWQTPLGPGLWSLGRAPGNDLMVADPHLTRAGFVLEVQPGECRLRAPDGRSRRLPLGRGFVLGGSVFLLSPPGDDGARTRTPAEHEFAYPPPLVPERPRRLMLLGMLMPLIASGIVVAVTQMWTFLLLSLAAPVTGVLSWWLERRCCRRTNAERRRRRQVLLRQLEHDLDRARHEVAAQRTEEFRHGLAHGSAETAWLGFGAASGPITVERGGALSRPVLPPAAIGVPLVDRILELRGPSREVHGLLRAVVALSPHHVRLRCPAPLAPSFEYLALHGIRADDGAERPAPGQTPWLLVQVQPTEGSFFVTIALGERHRSTAVVVLGPGHGELHEDEQRTVFAPALLSEATFHTRMLRTRERRLHGSAVAPGPVALTRLLSLDEAALRERWARRPASTRFPLGMTTDGPCWIDLARQGPHALIAGTTGSGKSQLLETMVTALCAVNSPAHLNVLLIDYKGGAAFTRCARLPHVSGLITDLDAHETARALSSLTAELQRRERLLAETGAHHIAEHNERARVPLPRLLIVIDEFRALATALPELIGGLVSLAALGRSLGMHLVLATQRPAGIVTQDMRANLGLRIALRVRDRTDALDVLESEAAVRLPANAPGRGYLRSDASPETLFHTALLCAAEDDRDPPLRGPEITELSPEEYSPGAQRSEAGEDVPFDPECFRRAAEGVRAEPVWLPPLPHRVSHAEAQETAPPAARPGSAFALADEPRRQRRIGLTVEADAPGHLLALGSPRSGRTTLVRTLLVTSRDDTAAYLIDPGRQLTALQDDPRVHGWFTAEAPWRIGRLMEWLDAELARRRGDASRRSPLLLAVDGWEAFTQLDPAAISWLETLGAVARSGQALGLRLVLTGERRLATTPLAASIPDRLVLRLADPHDVALLGVPVKAMPAAMPPGRGLFLGNDESGARRFREVHIVDPDTLPDPLGAPPQTTMSFVPLPDSIPEPAPLPDSDADAVAPRSPEPDLPPATASVSAPVTAWEPAPAPTPARGPAPESASSSPSGNGDAIFPLGVHGDACTRFDYRPGVHGPALLIAGHPSSGRSTVLRRALRSLGGSRPALALGQDLPGSLQLSDFTAALADADPGALIVVDDHETCPREVDHALTARLGAASGDIVLLATGFAPGQGYAGLPARLRTLGPVLLLGTRTGTDGDLVGRRDLLAIAGPPGRGWLSVRGRLQPIQLFSEAPTPGGTEIPGWERRLA